MQLKALAIGTLLSLGSVIALPHQVHATSDLTLDAQNTLIQNRKLVASEYDELMSKVSGGKAIPVIVKLKEGSQLMSSSEDEKVTIDTMQQLNNLKLFAKNEIPSKHLALFEVNETQLNTMIDSGLVEYVVEDMVLQPHLAESTELTGAVATHNIGYGGAGQTVVIIDTGIQAGHHFYAARVVEEACFSTSTSSIQSFCRNGASTDFGPGAADGCSDVIGIGSCNHGTFVTGIAAGNGNSMDGMAPDANIILVEAGSNSENGLGLLSFDVIRALTWVEELYDSGMTNIAAVNLSIGSPRYRDYCDDSVPAYTAAIENLRSRGIATVISAGNSGFTDSVGFPGCISSAITVGGVDDNDNIIFDTAPMVDLVAPGANIYSSASNSYWTTSGGTSASAPHVTGAIAVLKSFDPTLSVDQIEQLLETNSVPVTRIGHTDVFPRLNVAYAVGALDPSLKPNSAPAFLYAAVNDDDISLKWGQVNDADYYIREVSTSASSPNWFNPQKFDANSTSITYYNKTPGYRQYRLKACTDFGCSGWVVSGSVTVEDAPTPGTPTVSAVVNGGDDITVSWTEMEHTTEYVREVSTSASSPNWFNPHTLPSTQTSVTYNNKTPGYRRYRIKACNDNNCSSWGYSNEITVLAVPTPTSVTASVDGDDITVTWTSITSATHYIREVSITPSAPHYFNPNRFEAPQRTVTYENKSPGPRQYRIKSCNDAGCSSWAYSNPITVAATIPTPTSVTASVDGDDITVTWTSITSATYYIREVSITPSAPHYFNPNRFEAPQRTVTYENKSPGPRQYRIKSCNDAGCSSWAYSNAITVN